MAPVAKNDTNEVQKVSMNLTRIDLENLEYLVNRFNCRSSVNAVSKSMQMARDLCELIDDPNKTILTKDRSGNLSEIVFFV